MHTIRRSGAVPIELAADSKLRLRWIVPADSETVGWTFGLDNVELALLGNLQAGDADQDQDFDQLDLVQVQIGGKYLSGEPATWGEGDWNGAPGGFPGGPPQGDGVFNQLDIVAAQQAAVYVLHRRPPRSVLPPPNSPHNTSARMARISP